MTLGWLILLSVGAAMALLLVRATFAAADRPADACTPEEVLAAFVWEVRGRYENGVYQGRHRDRDVKITLAGGSYCIEIEGVPAAGDLEGKDALAWIKGLVQSWDARTLDEVPDWQAILRVFHAVPIRMKDGRLLAEAPFGGGVLGPHEETLRLRRLLDRLVEVTQVARVAFELRARAATDTRCPYCHDDVVGTKAQTTACPKCGAIHHVDCFVEHGKCAVFACSARAINGLRDLSGPGKPIGGSIRSS